MRLAGLSGTPQAPRSGQVWPVYFFGIAQALKSSALTA